jgi:diguanylate cyclase (GGDEF)-like protein
MALLFWGPLSLAATTTPPSALVPYGMATIATYLLVFAVAGAQHGAFVPIQILGLLAIAASGSMQHATTVRQRRELDRISRTDPLTGSLNRRGFEERFAAELAVARRTGGDLALLLVDLDDFKQVNDTHGHAAGDELLRWTVEAMRDVLRGHDVVGRLGGDEFAAVLPAAGPEEASAAAERVAARLRDRTPASIGIASMGPDGATPDELGRAADRSLYARKGARLRQHTGFSP